MRRAGLVLAGLCVFAVLAAACGSAATPKVASIGTTTSTPKAAAAAAANPTFGTVAADAEKFSACMRSHGVTNFPDPIVGVASVNIRITPAVANSPRFNTAQAACQRLLPGRPTAQQFSTQQQADYLKAAACMRSHGIVGFPDPVFPSAGVVRFPLPPGMDANSTPFRAARVICEKLIPQGLPYSN